MRCSVYYSTIQLYKGVQYEAFATVIINPRLCSRLRAADAGVWNCVKRWSVLSKCSAVDCGAQCCTALHCSSLLHVSLVQCDAPVHYALDTPSNFLHCREKATFHLPFCLNFSPQPYFKIIFIQPCRALYVASYLPVVLAGKSPNCPRRVSDGTCRHLWPGSCP